MSVVGRESLKQEEETGIADSTSISFSISKLLAQPTVTSSTKDLPPTDNIRRFSSDPDPGNCDELNVKIGKQFDRMREKNRCKQSDDLQKETTEEDDRNQLGK